MSARPPILIVVENLPVPLDRRVWQEACALRDAGYAVAVICPQMRGYTLPEETIEGIQIHRHPISGEAGGFTGFFREYMSALWGEFWLAWKIRKRHRFEILHLCNPPDLLFLVALPFKWIFGVRIIYDVHDAWPEMYEAKFNQRGFFHWAVRVAERLTYACAKVVLATNDSMRAIAFNRGGKKPDTVFVVRTAPNISGHNQAPDFTLKKGRRYLVGYVGVMGNTDGVDYLIEAAAHLIHKLGRTDVQFLLMGTGPEWEKMRELRDARGLEAWVDLPGRVTNELLFRALLTIDVGISSDPMNDYNHHCTMNKVLEYMAFGKPQVMFNLKEGRVSAGEAAVYVSENSAVKLAEALVQLLEDPAARERMGRLGEERLRTQLNWQRSVEQLIQAYEAALRD